jgi:hypothetical protein
MDLLHLVDRLEELVAGAQKMPIGNRAIVDRRRMLDLIDQMRIAVPREVREAQDIVAQRDAIRREAEEEGRIIVAQAEERAAELVEDHAIAEAAKRRAEEIAAEAERRLEQQIEAANRDIQARIQESRRISREQMHAADEYARELLIRLERQLQAFQNSVHAGIQQLEPQPPSFADTLPDLERGPDSDDPFAAFDAPEDTRGSLSGGASAEDVFAGIRMEQPGGYAQPSWTREAAQREIDREAGRDFGSEPDRESGDADLENLLRPRPGQLTLEDDVEPAEPGVIDDFEHDPLDDDPIIRPGRDRRQDFDSPR